MTSEIMMNIVAINRNHSVKPCRLIALRILEFLSLKRLSPFVFGSCQPSIVGGVRFLDIFLALGYENGLFNLRRET